MATTNPVKGRDEIKPINLGQTAADWKDKAQHVESTGVEKAKEGVATIAEKAKETASSVGRKAEDATCAVGSGMQSLATNIREKGPERGVLGSASSAVANTLDSGGRYLKEEGLKGIGEDLTNLIRRNPIPALLFGIGLGFLIAQRARS